jgi:hypothetical protein
MPVPTRPSTGGPVESVWGQEVHDRIFLPAGGIFRGGAAVGVAPAKCKLTALSDPGGWLSGGDTLVCPADAEGVYLVAASMRIELTAGGAASVVGQLAIAGATFEPSYYLPSAPLAVNLQFSPVLLPVAVGQQVYLAGLSPAANVLFYALTLDLIRVGGTLAAP